MLLKRVQSCHPTPLTTLSEVTIGMGTNLSELFISKRYTVVSQKRAH